MHAWRGCWCRRGARRFAVGAPLQHAERRAADARARRARLPAQRRRRPRGHHEELGWQRAAASGAVRVR
eukprot:1430339-Pleurochrysis_carterae.AAC.1